MVDGFAAQGGNTQADEPAMHRVCDLIAEVQPNAMVTKFVLLVETVDDEDTAISSFTSPGLKEWQSMGMLQWALDAEGRTRLDDGEGDDD